MCVSAPCVSRISGTAQLEDSIADLNLALKPDPPFLDPFSNLNQFY
jgi:hypothetical protein